MKRRKLLYLTSGVIPGFLSIKMLQSSPAIAISFDSITDKKIITEDGTLDDIIITFSEFKIKGFIENTTENIKLNLQASVNNTEKTVYDKLIEINSSDINEDLSNLTFNLKGDDKFDMDDFNYPTEGGELEHNSITITIELQHTDIKNISESTSFELTIEKENTVIEAFKSTSEHTWNPPQGVTEADILVVGGGGAGGNGDSGTDDSGGGGGAGSVVYKKDYDLTDSDEINIKVGDGGIPSNNTGSTGNNGEESYFGDIQAKGGGAGGGASDDAKDGGNGGGAGGTSSTGGSSNGGESLDENGYSGGDSEVRSGAGGGGAGKKGEDGISDADGGQGGEGVYMGDIFTDDFGENGWFGGGGGGGGADGGGNADGGKGGGGKGGQDRGTDPDSGSPNTGGGGGGGADEMNDESSGTAKKGGSGVVIIKYVE